MSMYPCHHNGDEEGSFLHTTIQKNLRVLAVQSIVDTDDYFSVAPVENIMMLFRGSAIRQGLVYHFSSSETIWKPNDVYIRTTGCQMLPGGIYRTFHHSLEALDAILPPEVFYWASQCCLINHRRLVGRQVMGQRGRRRTLVFRDGKNSLSHVFITKNYLPELLEVIGIPRHRRKKRQALPNKTH